VAQVFVAQVFVVQVLIAQALKVQSLDGQQTVNAQARIITNCNTKRQIIFARTVSIALLFAPWRAKETTVALSISNYNYAPSNARADFYQGTAAIASWLSGLAAPGNQGNTTPASTSTQGATPNVTVSTATDSFNKFRSQVSAATTASSSDAASQQAQSGSQDNAGYQNAVAAYSDS
jgi:hypothetical protein